MSKASLTECIRGGSQDSQPGFVIAFRYDTDIVEALKQAVPHTEREWREDTKTWWISERYGVVLRGLFTNFEALVYLQQHMF